MGPGRLAPSVVAVMLFTVSGLSQVRPPLPGPTGYRLVDVSSSDGETEDFPTGPLDRVSVTGSRTTALYEPLPLLRQRPLDLLRHYATTTAVMAGTRLFGVLDDQGGQLAAVVPGVTPTWLNVRVSDEGGGLEVVFVQEARTTTRALPVPAEKIAGRWATQPPALDGMPSTSRTAFMTLFTRVSTAWRAATAMSPPLGATYSTITSSDGGFNIVLLARPRFQACLTCELIDGDGRGLVTLSFDKVEDAAPLSALKGPGGVDWFEWRVATQPSPLETHTREGRVVLTHPAGPPLWIPVSQEAYLSAQIAVLDDAGRTPDMKKALAEQEEAIRLIEKTDPAAARAAREAMRQALAALPDTNAMLTPERQALEQRLKSLSTADRRTPATLPDGAMLVAQNPAYFQAASDGPQLVVVRYHTPQDYFFEDLIDRLKAVGWAGLLNGKGAVR